MIFYTFHVVRSASEESLLVSFALEISVRFFQYILCKCSQHLSPVLIYIYYCHYLAPCKSVVQLHSSIWSNAIFILVVIQYVQVFQVVVLFFLLSTLLSGKCTYPASPPEMLCVFLEESCYTCYILVISRVTDISIQQLLRMTGSYLCCLTWYSLLLMLGCMGGGCMQARTISCCMLSATTWMSKSGRSNSTTSIISIGKCVTKYL